MTDFSNLVWEYPLVANLGIMLEGKPPARQFEQFVLAMTLVANIVSLYLELP